MIVQLFQNDEFSWEKHDLINLRSRKFATPNDAIEIAPNRASISDPIFNYMWLS